MSVNNPLLDTPTARIPTLARWYIASVLVAILILFTVHLQVQLKSAGQIDILMQHLAKQHGVTLGEVRFRMLRGALTLRQVEVNQEGFQFIAPYILLRGNFSSDIEQVRLSEFHMQKGMIQLAWPNLKGGEKPTLPIELLPDEWQAMFASARKIIFDEIVLNIMLAADSKEALSFQRFHLEGKGASPRRTWFGSSQGDLGLAKLHITSDMLRLDWQQVHFDQLQPFLSRSKQAVNGLKGHLKGFVLWQQDQINGSMDWYVDDSEGRIAWQGRKLDGQWQGNIDVVNWPLATAGLLFPNIAGCTLQAGSLDGTWHVKGGGEQWQISSNEIDITNLVASDQYSSACWEAEQLTLRGSSWKWPELTLLIKQANMNHGSLRMPESIPSQGGIWKSQIEQVTFADMTLSNADTRMKLTDVYGDAEWKEDSWQLHAYKYVEGTSTIDDGQWSIALAHDHSQPSRIFSFSVKGEAVSPAFFRDVLPSRLAKGATLNASMHADLQGYVDQTADHSLVWHITGDLFLERPSWQRGGWQWVANHISVNGLTFNSGEPMHASSVELSSWRLTAPLSPMGQPVAQGNSWQPFWLDGWNIKKLQVGTGSFSVGWPDSIWMTTKAFEVRPVSVNESIKLKLRGTIFEGEMTADVYWFPWESPGWFGIQASVRHALPFASNTWLLQSDMPDFIQGRLSMDLHIQPAAMKDLYAYDGVFNIQLSHAALAQGVHRSEQFKQVFGLGPYDALSQLSSGGDMSLAIPLQGNWSHNSMSWAYLGAALVKTMQQKIKKGAAIIPHQKRGETRVLAYIRLHKDDQLWPNERARVRQTIDALMKNPKLVLELVPQLGRSSLNQQFIDVVRRTQQLIEDYMHKRHTSRARIIPLWPQKSHLAGGEAGIRLQVYAIDE